MLKVITSTSSCLQVIRTYRRLIRMLQKENLPPGYEPPPAYNTLVGRSLDITVSYSPVLLIKKLKGYSRAWFRSTDLWVMGPARFHCATLLLLQTVLFVSGMTPLHQAVMEENTAAVRLLTRHCDVNRKDIDSWTPLHAACANGFSDVVK